MPNRSLRPKAMETQMAIARRQLKLSQLLEQHKEESPTYERMVELMLEDDFVRANWPGYGLSAVHGDFKAIFGMVQADIKQLAKIYFSRQVALNENITQQLVNFVEDEELSPKLRIDAAKALRSYIDQQVRMFGNYAAKETHSLKATLKMDYEQYMALREKAERQLEAGEVIDGEFEARPDDDSQS